MPTFLRRAGVAALADSPRRRAYRMIVYLAVSVLVSAPVSLRAWTCTEVAPAL